MAFDSSRADYLTEKAREVREWASRTRGKILKEEYEAIAMQYEHLAASSALALS